MREPAGLPTGLPTSVRAQPSVGGATLLPATGAPHGSVSRAAAAILAATILMGLRASLCANGSWYCSRPRYRIVAPTVTRQLIGGPTRATVDPDVPRHAAGYGFRIDPIGTHLSRTIMLKELRALLAACPATASTKDYRAVVVDDNLLAKPTASARRTTFDRLRELYALDPAIWLFRSLRDLWDTDQSAQPLLALLCATARDPILRAMTAYVLSLPVGTRVTPQMLSEEAERQYPGKFRPLVLAGLGRNAASSWQQAGLLQGRSNKERARPESRPTSLAYALLLGDLCGRRGAALFDTLWARMLDAPAHLLREQAVAASRQGWIEYRAAGDVVEVSFRHLTREEPRGGT